MAGFAELEKHLKSAIVASASIGKWTQQALAALGTRSAKLEAALKAANPTMVELLASEIETSLRKGEQEMANVDFILKEDIAPCRGNSEFAEQHAKQIEVVVEKLSGWKADVRRAFESAEKLLARAEAAQQKAATGKDAALDALAALDLKVKDRVAELQTVVEMAAEAQQKSIDALAKRDAAALKSAQRTMDAANPEGEQKSVDQLVSEIDALQKRWKPAGLGADADKQIAATCEKLKKKAEALRGPLLASLVTAKMVHAYDLPKPDARKAIKALGLPDGNEAKVTKALGLGSKAMEAAFDALAKELKLKSSGKQMVGTLAKAGLI